MMLIAMVLLFLMGLLWFVRDQHLYLQKQIADMNLERKHLLKMHEDSENTCEKKMTSVKNNLRFATLQSDAHKNKHLAATTEVLAMQEAMRELIVAFGMPVPGGVSGRSAEVGVHSEAHVSPISVVKFLKDKFEQQEQGQSSALRRAKQCLDDRKSGEQEHASRYKLVQIELSQRLENLARARERLKTLDEEIETCTAEVDRLKASNLKLETIAENHANAWQKQAMALEQLADRNTQVDTLRAELVDCRRQRGEGVLARQQEQARRNQEARFQENLRKQGQGQGST